MKYINKLNFKISHLNIEENIFYLYGRPYLSHYDTYTDNYLYNLYVLRQQNYYTSRTRKLKQLYRLNQHSYAKKLINFNVRHGLKLLSIQAVFYSFYSLFLSINAVNSNVKNQYSHFNTLLYNLNNYLWLRSIVSLWIWSCSWIDFLFKFSLIKTPTRAGRKKKPLRVKSLYITPVKRPLIINFYLRYLVKSQPYRLFRDRNSSIFFDVFFNYKNSVIYNIKANTYRKLVQELKQI